MSTQFRHKDSNWLAHLKETALQEPLIETRPTLASLQRAVGSRPPRAIFVGIGICSRRRISRALPVDVLGLLLPAERLRRVTGAAAVVVVVADEHARINGFDPYLVQSRAQSTVRTLQRLRRCGLERMQVIKASSFHDCDDYRAILARVERGAPTGEHPYFLREAADIEYLHRRFGGILKVGWTVGPTTGGRGRLDELAFDRRFRNWMGRHVGFVYCKAGRTLDVRSPKTAPYISVNPQRRICLSPDEDVAAKLQRAASSVPPDVLRGARKQLKRIARAFNGLVRPVSGLVEQRVQSILHGVFHGWDGAEGTMACAASRRGGGAKRRCMNA